MANTITIRRGMAERLSNKTPLKFSDVAAYFSEEEWKLLHEWQNELYNNVMKEIQQALSSLGPLIASSVFSLRAKEKEDMCPVGNQYTQRKDSAHLPTSDVNSISEESFRISQEKKEYLLGHPDSGRMESNHCLLSEFESVMPIVSFTIKEEDDVEDMDQHDCEPMKHTSYRKGFNVHSTKSETSGVDNISSQVAKANTYIIEDDGSMNIKQNFGHSIKSNDKSAACSSSAAKAEAKVVQSFVESVQCASQLWSVNDQEKKGEQSGQIKSQSNFQQPAHTILDHKIPNQHRSATFNKGQSIQIDANIIPCDTSAMQGWRPYSSPVSQPAVHPKEIHVERKRTHTEKGQGAYTECVQNLSATSKHVQRERTHARERPHSCSVCGKSFNNKHIFIRHQKTHTGERPHKCNVCGNSFRLKAFLNQHLNIHTGERPFHCTICGKSFSRKGTLVRHQAVHMK